MKAEVKSNKNVKIGSKVNRNDDIVRIKILI